MILTPDSRSELPATPPAAYEGPDPDYQQLLDLAHRLRLEQDLSAQSAFTLAGRVLLVFKSVLPLIDEEFAQQALYDYGHQLQEQARLCRTTGQVPWQLRWFIEQAPQAYLQYAYCETHSHPSHRPGEVHAQVG